MITELEKYQDLIAYEDGQMMILTPNIGKAGGTIFIYLHKLTLDVLVIDAGIGFESVRSDRRSTDPKDRLSADDRRILAMLDILAARGARFYGFLTHGHLDHIIGAWLLSERYNITWVCSETTQAMIQRTVNYGRRRDDQTPIPQLACQLITEDFQTFDCGPFRLNLIPTVHSIPETFSVVISTEEGFHFLHLAEFRGQACSREAGLSQKMLTGIAQNCRRRPYRGCFYDKLRGDEGEAPVEDVIREPVEAILNHPAFQKERVLIVPFISSKVNQIAILQEIANRSDCLLWPAGRAMREMTEYGRKRGWIKEQLPSLTRRYKRILQPATGSQNEPNSAMRKALAGLSRDLYLLPGDWVLVIQSAIPFYLAEVRKMYKKVIERGNRLVLPKVECRRLGLDPNHPKILLIDDLIGQPFKLSTGHGYQEDQRKVLSAGRFEDERFVIGYQSEEDVQAEVAVDSEEAAPADLIDIETLRKQLLEILHGSSLILV